MVKTTESCQRSKNHGHSDHCAVHRGPRHGSGHVAQSLKSVSYSAELRRAAWQYLWLVGLLLATASRAAAQSNDDCLSCHAKQGLSIERDGRSISLYVDMDRVKSSIHADLECVTCHGQLDGVEKWPHESGLERVDCGNCHEDDDGPINAYWSSTHGRLAKQGDSDAPICQDCHGSHYILPLSNLDSSISPFNIPAMCAQCHAEGANVERTHNIPQHQILQRYKQSIHGEGLFKQGLVVTAVCTSCHTGHNVLPHADPASTIHRDNVVSTCMKCHGLIEDVHRKVVAGELWEKEGAVPLCVECHSPHEARKVFYDTNMSNADCLRCHGKAPSSPGDGNGARFVDAQEHARSIHGRRGVSCAQCHAGASASQERSCATMEDKVNCAVCHELEASDFNRGKHGQLYNAGDLQAPYCTDCHGIHNILEHKVPENSSDLLTTVIRGSPTYSRNVPKLCGGCHGAGQQAAVRYFGDEDEIVKHYGMSIHGKGLLDSGLTVTATCTACHTPHRELPADDPESSVNGANIVATCGQCHDGIYERYQRSIHSVEGNPTYDARRQRGMPELPQCNDCHYSHQMNRTDLDEFQLGIIQQCGKCHAEVTETYFDTYHGKAYELGDATRAKCHDCHGAHDILPPTDSRSRLHRDRIVETCGQCHPGSHRQFAGYLTHATHHDPDKYPILYYTFWGMTSLLIGTFSVFGLHTLAWLPRSWKLRQELRTAHRAANGQKQFVRFTSLQRKLHVSMILSFFGLALTGMMLKFAYTPWAVALSRLFGGMDAAGWVHRLCALVTFGYFLTHLWNVSRKYWTGNVTLFRYLFGPGTILPLWSDVGEMIGTVKWFFGVGPRPQYGRWTYWEKFDYFAVFWGVAIIGSTGLCLWFPELFTRFLPGWSINVATIIHSDEALLATGFIFTIHFFNTHFRPEKFPMDTTVFTGRMSVQELKQDKPRLYQELVDSGDLENNLADPPSEKFVRVAKCFGYTALAVGFTLVGLIIYAMLFAYR